MMFGIVMVVFWQTLDLNKHLKLAPLSNPCPCPLLGTSQQDLPYIFVGMRFSHYQKNMLYPNLGRNFSGITACNIQNYTLTNICILNVED